MAETIFVINFFLLRLPALLLLLFFSRLLSAQADTSHSIKVHFWYGSKPLHSTKKTESKYFGGLHGGHVTIEVDSIDYGLVPGNGLHIFAHKKNLSGIFSSKRTYGLPPYPPGHKFVTFIIPVSAEQYQKINEINSCYCKQAPYDYAFFGMRCASAAYEVLSHLDIVKERSNFSNVCKNFYPKKLRKKLLRLARKNNWIVIRKQGRVSRKWERE